MGAGGVAIDHQLDRSARQRREVETARLVGVLEPYAAGRGIEGARPAASLEADGNAGERFSARVDDNATHFLIDGRQAEVIEASRLAGLDRHVVAGGVRVAADLDLGVVGCAGDQLIERVGAVVFRSCLVLSIDTPNERPLWPG